MALLRFSFENWTKFNPRADKANYTWFRMQNEFFHDQAIFKMTNSQRIIYLFGLCEVSKQGGKDVELESTYLAAMLSMKESEVIKDYNQVSKVTLSTSNGRPSTDLVPATDGRTDETDGTVSGLASTPLPQLAEIWNQESLGLAKVKGCSASRKRMAEARWKEKPDREYWIDIVRRIVQSSFCRGENERGWRADFDFLIRPETQHKVLEGKYSKHTGTAPAPRKEASGFLRPEVDWGPMGAPASWEEETA